MSRTRGLTSRTVVLLSVLGLSVLGLGPAASASMAKAPPVAVDDVYSGEEDVPLKTDSRNGVLANDHDPDGDFMRASRITRNVNHTWGTVDLRPDGSFTYTPPANWCGTDYFIYHVIGAPGAHPGESAEDSGQSAVTINVKCVNDPPGFTPGPAQTVASSAGPQTVTGWATNVSHGQDGGYQRTTFALTVPNASEQQLFKSLPTIDDSGTLRYEPAPGQAGTATVNVTLYDNGPSDAPNVNVSKTATFRITVVGQPLSLVADRYRMTEDSVLTVPAAQGVLANDRPGGGGPLVASVPDGLLPTHGILTFAAGGGFTYQPGPNFCGVDRFTYEARDTRTGESGRAAVDVRVVCVNDLAVGMAAEPLVYRAGPSAQPVYLDQNLTIRETEATIKGAKIVLTGGVAGQDILEWTTTDTDVPVTRTADGLTFTGSVPASYYEEVLRGVRYRNAAASPASGSRTVTITVTDLSGATATVTRTITIRPVGKYGGDRSPSSNVRPSSSDHAGGLLARLGRTARLPNARLS